MTDLSSAPPPHDPGLRLGRVAVLVKDVPAGPGPWSYAADRTLQRCGRPGTMSGVDLFAVAAAREAGTEVVAVTMGPPSSLGALREALCLGADRAVHVCDGALHGADALTTAHVLAQAVRMLEVDALFLGRESSDGRMGVLGGMLAELLGWPLVSGADRIRVGHPGLSARVRERSTELSVSASAPLVCSVAEYGAGPRRIDWSSLRRAFLTPVEPLTAQDLGLELPASPRQRLISMRDLERRREQRVVRGADVGILVDEFERALEPAS